VAWEAARTAVGCDSDQEKDQEALWGLADGKDWFPYPAFLPDPHAEARRLLAELTLDTEPHYPTALFRALLHHQAGNLQAFGFTEKLLGERGREVAAFKPGLVLWSSRTDLPAVLLGNCETAQEVCHAAIGLLAQTLCLPPLPHPENLKDPAQAGPFYDAICLRNRWGKEFAAAFLEDALRPDALACARYLLSTLNLNGSSTAARIEALVAHAVENGKVKIRRGRVPRPYSIGFEGKPALLTIPEGGSLTDRAADVAAGIGVNLFMPSCLSVEAPGWWEALEENNRFGSAFAREFLDGAER
jgi:hypothetical protein